MDVGYTKTNPTIVSGWSTARDDIKSKSLARAEIKSILRGSNINNNPDLDNLPDFDEEDGQESKRHRIPSSKALDNIASARMMLITERPPSSRASDDPASASI